MTGEGSRCVAPLDDKGERLCGRPATTERTIESVVMPMCCDHARELDDEQGRRDMTSYHCSECGAEAEQGTNEQGADGALHCAEHPTAVVDSIYYRGLTVHVSNVRPSKTVQDQRGAFDADVRIGNIEGEVTLLPRESDGELDTWGGSLDYWASQPLHAALSGNYDLIHEVVAAVARCAVRS